jgi:two-component system cell cycle response regulator DivK
VLARLKNNPETENIPVVAVTAYAMKGDKERLMKAGCAGYIAKPIDVHEFKKLIAQYLGK